MPHLVAAYILIVGYFQTLDRYKELAPMTLMRRLVYAYGHQYIAYIRDIASEGPHIRYRRKLASMLQSHWEGDRYRTDELNGVWSQGAQCLIADVVADMIHFNALIQSIRADHILPARCYDSFSDFFSHWTIHVWNNITSPWKQVIPFIYMLVVTHETLITHRVALHNACVRALRNLGPREITIIPDDITRHFNIQSTLWTSGTECLEEMGTEIESDEVVMSAGADDSEQSDYQLEDAVSNQ